MRHSRGFGVMVALVALAAAVSSGAHAALLDRVGVYVDGWPQTLTGDARIDGAAQGGNFSLTEDVGLDGEKTVGEIGAWFHPFGRHRLRVSGFVASLEGRKDLPRDLVIGDDTLLANTAVGSVLDLKFAKAHYSYSVVNKDIVNVALLVGLDYLDAKGEVTALEPAFQSAASVKGAVPAIGASVQVSPIGFLRIYGEVSGTSLTIRGIKADVRDALARVELYAGHVFGVGAGYRKFDLKVEEDGEGKIDVSTDGYQVYLLLRF